jgi:hypothetical protein
MPEIQVLCIEMLLEIYSRIQESLINRSLVFVQQEGLL